MIIHDVIQGSDEWLALRRGKMTASHAQAIATQGKGLETLCRRLASEIFTGESPGGYKNDNMTIGNEEEQYARITYELQNDVTVQQIGFGEYSEFVGASPDGIVNEILGVEFKRKTFDKHADLLFGVEKFESAYIWQCHMNMLVFDRKLWDLSSFNPLFKGRCMHTVRIERNAECDEKLLAGFDMGEKLIKQYLEILNN